MNTINWRILHIGGNSGTGKTFLAKKFVRQLSIPFYHGDHIYHDGYFQRS